jgi:dienelactone hydrolase
MRQLRLALGLCLLLGSAVCIGRAIAAQPRAEAASGEIVQIPLTTADGATVQLQARVCRPAGTARARLVVLNHGSPPHDSSRPTMKLGRCEDDTAQWFLARGYVVVFALRRGYGATGGDWAETYGGCEKAHYQRAGLETARDIDAVVAYATALPFVRPDGAVVVGHSAGAWGAIAYDSLPHPKVAAFINMSGGRGAHQEEAASGNCRPERLAEAARHFGKTASTPMLWVYPANDTYFPPAIAKSMYDAFVAAGGKADFEQPGPRDGEGHGLFGGAGGAAIWGPLVERYLARQLSPAG